jgi:hypothetical protein
VKARYSSTLARVCCSYIVGLSLVEISILICWFALVDRVGSWLYCIGKNILSKKSLLGFSPLRRRVFQDKSLCLLVFVYLLLYVLVYAY